MYLQVQVSTPTKEVADSLIKELLRVRLIACGQVLGPIESHYWWKDTLESSQEYLCLMKTREDLYPKVERLVEKVHPYEVPEIIAQPIQVGLKAYLEWIDTETS